VRKKKKRRRKKSAATIQAIARGFRLSKHDMGIIRKLPVEQSIQLAAVVDADPSKLRMQKMLFDRHAALTGKSRAAHAVVKTFDALTLPYPDERIRLLPVHSKDTEDQAEEIREFLNVMKECISRHTAAVDKVIRDWDDILAKTKLKLRKCFDPADYPDPRHLHRICWIELEPVSLEVPAYLKEVDPAAYEEQMVRLKAKFDEAIRMQEECIIDSFQSSLQRMMTNLEGLDDGKKKRRFSNAAVTRVFDALEEFQRCSGKYSILKGSKLGTEFDQLRDVMRGATGMRDAKQLIQAVKTNDRVREETREQVGQIFENIQELAEARPRRRLLRR
jgi:hypothetical protein